jgi:hypothetical protein
VFFRRGRGVPATPDDSSERRALSSLADRNN